MDFIKYFYVSGHSEATKQNKLLNKNFGPKEIFSEESVGFTNLSGRILSRIVRISFYTPNNDNANEHF